VNGTTAAAETSMSVTVVGCAGSFPGPASPASCYLLSAEHGGRRWHVVMDLGGGALGALQRHADPMLLDAVLLSHLHPDHCLDLTGLHVMRTHHPRGAARDRLDVFAPPGAADRLARAYGVEAASSVEDAYRFHALADRETFSVGPFSVEPFAVRHPVAAFGFRVGAGSATLAYTGDTDSCDALVPLMTEADLVLADSAFVEGRDTARGVHLTGRRAAQAAVDAGGVRRLMLTHIPAWNDPEACRAEAAEVWPGIVEVARPGERIQLPR
jgi:ribonuclease BN (tRNA processing enzyme)